MRTIAIVNQKGGCGKTTTAINLSAYLAENKRKVLLMDLDPQSHSSIGLNVKVNELEKSIYDTFSKTDKIGIDEVIIKIDNNFDLAPSQLILSAVEQELSGLKDRENLLHDSIRMMQEKYDYLLIDCPPSLGILTFNALRACNEALIPIDMSIFSLQGVARLLQTINILKSEKGHDVRPMALATICNPRTLFAHEVRKNIEKHFNKNMYKTFIHRTVKLKEAASYGIPVSKYCKKCTAALDYNALANEIIFEEKKLKFTPMPSQLGPRKEKGEIIFKYYDPNAREVQIAGDFTDWKPVKDLMSVQKGNKLWSGALPLKAGIYQYKYIVDGEWKIDPFNPKVTDGEVGIKNSLLEVVED